MKIKNIGKNSFVISFEEITKIKEKTHPFKVGIYYFYIDYLMK